MKKDDILHQMYRYMKRALERPKILVLVVVIIIISAAASIPFLDFDGDGLSNQKEWKYGTDIYKEDSSGDGLSDADAITYWLNPHENYPQDYVDTFYMVKNISKDAARTFSIGIMYDDNVTENEKKFMDKLEVIHKYDEKSVQLIIEAVMQDYKVSDEEHEFIDKLIQFNERYPGNYRKITTGYLNDSVLNDIDVYNFDIVIGSDEDFIKKVIQENIFAVKDWDNDSLQNHVEKERGLDYDDPDTDMDGLLDGNEVLHYRTDPLEPNVYLGRVKDRLTEDGTFSNQDFKYLQMLAVNEKNKRYQILQNYYHYDGNITTDELQECKDSDEDGLINAFEMSIGTHKHMIDTDMDYVSDWDEYFIYATDPLNRDTDGDGLIDGDEIDDYKTDPKDVDTDGDHLYDYEEVHYFDTNPNRVNQDIGQFRHKLDDGDELTFQERLLINIIKENRHNIKYQILERGYENDGKIESQEFYYSIDPDDDGLITINEMEIGTDRYSRDTDKDGLLDGWEVYGFKRKNNETVPLDEYGADPLHMDIFVELLGDYRLPDEMKQMFVTQFARAPVSNPDGSTGIRLHLDDDTENYSLGGKNPDVDDYPYSNSMRNHPRYGVFYFGKMKPIDFYAGTGDCPGFNFIISTKEPISEDLMPFVFFHELGHNLLGKLDSENQYSYGDQAHGKYYNYAMYPFLTKLDRPTYHPNVWKEIDRDGLVGLPRLSKPYIWRSVEWIVPYYGE